MSCLPSSSHHPTPAETGSIDGEQHELVQTQAQNTQSPVSSTYPELPEEWKSGLRLEDRLKDMENDFTEEERRDAWKVVDQAVKTYSDEMVQRWIAEMDTLLVYAGLFSAVLTAFNVESYMLLSPPVPDPVLAALTRISAQLESFSVHDPFVNSTQPAFQPSSVSSNSTSAQSWAVWLNALWFSSLICSLSAASVAIMVKQWIHEYNSGISGTSRHTARLRQYRYNGLVRWKVAAIIAVLPILLQTALGLYLAGLLVLLWNLNRTVAIIASNLVGALLAFTLATIILPTLTSNCAYLSPLSMSLFRSCRLISTPIRALIGKAATSICDRVPSGSILWSISFRLRFACWNLLPSSVQAVQSVYVERTTFALDQDVFVTAYSTSGDLSLLEQASICFSDRSINELNHFITRIHAQNREYGQSEGTSVHWTQSIPLDLASTIPLIRNCSTFGCTCVLTSAQHTHTMPSDMDRYLYWSHVVPGDHRVSCMLSNMAAVLYNDGRGHSDTSHLDPYLRALKKQVNSVKETRNVLSDAVWRRVTAAMYTMLHICRASLHPMHLLQGGMCLHILISCSSPSAFPSQLGDMAEEDTRWKPLVDAIALAEDEVVRRIQSPGFRHSDNFSKFFEISCFLDEYQGTSLEQLARRVSEKMLRTLVGAIQDYQPEEEFEKARKNIWLEWLMSLEKERDKQISKRAAEKDERTASSSRVAQGMSEGG